MFRLPILVPIQSIEEDININETNNINRYTFTTPYRNDGNMNFSDTNRNTTESGSKTSSDYKKYKSSTISNLSSLYPLPYASPTLFKSKITNLKITNNSNHTAKSISALKIPLSSDYWRNRLKRRDLISVFHLD